MRGSLTVLYRHLDRVIVVATLGNPLALVVNGLDSTYGYDSWRGLTFPDVYELQFHQMGLEGIRSRVGPVKWIA